MGYELTVYHNGTDGNACPVVCPAACGTGQMNCYAGLDANGCLMPETCAPTNGSQLKSNSFQKTSFKIMYPFMSNLPFLNLLKRSMRFTV